MFPRDRTSRMAAITCLVLAILLAGIAWYLGSDAREALPKRYAAEQNPQVIDHVHTVKWWVSSVGAILLLIAAGTAVWWAGPAGRWGVLDALPLPRPTWRWWLAAGLIILAGAALRGERMALSLYNDEAYSFRRYISGHERTDQNTGEKAFREAKWVDTLWHMQVGNNSPPFSLLSRISYQTAAKHNQFAIGQVHEPSIRAPAFLAGLAGILLIGLVARRFGSPDAGILAMAVMAIHPWAIQFSTAARGHSFLLFLIPLLMLAVWHALRKGTWLPWLGVGATSALLMWTFPGSIHPLIALNAVIGIWLFRTFIKERDKLPAVRVQTSRWLLSNALAALFFLLLYGPLANQMREVMRGDDIPGSLVGGPSWSWWPDALSQLAIGMRWHDANPASPHASAVTRSLEQGDPFTLITLILLGVMTLAGFVWWCLRTRAGGILAAIGFGTPLLAFTIARLTDTVLHTWYVLAALPALIIMLAGVSGWLREKRFAIAMIPRTALAATLVLWLVTIATPLQNYGRNSLHPLRDAAERVSGKHYPTYLNQAEQSIKFATFWTDLSIYAPFAITTWSIEELQEVEAQAKAEQKSLYVVFGHRSSAVRTRPELVEYLEESGNYKHVKNLYAAGESQFNYHLYSWINPDDPAPSHPVDSLE